MNTLKVPYYKQALDTENALEALFAELPAQSINVASWSEYPYIPLVTFKVAHNGAAILLNYEVEESFLRINNFHPNESVWEDSCVEFFISFREDFYYNLEFNSLGVALIGYGPAEKSSRQRLPNETIEQIKSFSTIKKKMDESVVRWSLSLYIPIEVFVNESFPSFSAVKGHANFYKCGDLLPKPHFLSWNPITAPAPNFHLPTYFGEIEFE